jgi:hypothetical protein
MYRNHLCVPIRRCRKPYNLPTMKRIYHFSVLLLSSACIQQGMASSTVSSSSLAKLRQQNTIPSGIEASVMGESALVDKETGRIFWEGGSSSTLSNSVGPKIEQFGIGHIKATILSAILVMALAGALASFLREKLEQSVATKTLPKILSIGIFLVNWTILNVPKLDRWFVVATIILYLIEAYFCSTRRYLGNAINSPSELEAFIEKLREEPPEVIWTVRSFHYEKPLWLSPIQLTRSLWRRLKKEDDDESPDSSSAKLSSSLLRRKVVTNRATGTYRYKECIDKTTLGLWKRAPAPLSSAAPFTKMTLSKLLILSNEKARKDYFKQQSDFVTEHGQGDEYAEFSTNIQVAGFKPRMLAIRPIEGVPSAKLFRSHLFWIFTALGLTVPYRIWFARHCDELRVAVIKETASELPVQPSRSWMPFSSSRTPAEPTSPSDEQGIFRSLMQELKLYAQHDTSEERQNATAAVLEDVEVASILANKFDVTSDLPVNQNATVVVEDEPEEVIMETATNNTTANFTMVQQEVVLADSIVAETNANTTKPTK